MAVKKMTYILVDTANTFFRARHVVRGEADVKIGMALHTTFQSIRKAWKDFNGRSLVHFAAFYCNPISLSGLRRQGYNLHAKVRRDCVWRKASYLLHHR